METLITERDEHDRCYGYICEGLDGKLFLERLAHWHYNTETGECVQAWPESAKALLEYTLEGDLVLRAR